MSGKFMKIKKILIPTVTMVIIASQLFGCSCSTQSELHSMIERGEQIEIEVAEPNFTEQGTESKLTWISLGSNTEDGDFRKAFEILLGITTENGIKNGIAYINLDGKTEQNNTLYNAFMNKSFLDNYWNNEEAQEAVKIAVAEHYADIESDSDEAKYVALYLYWNLLPDYEPNYANMGSSLTRAEAMTFLMRATTQVASDGKPVSNADFKALVGEGDYTDYASYLDSKAFINTSDKSLNNQTFNGTMTRGEFIYLLINNTFGADAINNVDTSSTKLNDCKDGGSKIEAQKFGDGDYSTSYKLVYALQNADLGAPTPIYKALVKAKQLDIISAETAWDEALTREDAAELFVETMLAYSNVNGSKLESDFGELNTAEYTKEAEDSYEANKADLDCTKEEFINMYVSTILDGKTSEEALANCMANFIKTPDVTVEDDSNHKEPEIYYDEDGVPHIKEEETTKGNGTYTYSDDIKNLNDARTYFEGLGYKLSNPVTADEVRAIHKDFSNAISSEELENHLYLSPNSALSMLAMSTLPANPNAVAEEKSTGSSDSYFVEDSYKKPDTQEEQETTSSTEEETTEPSIDNPNGRPGHTFDDLTPEDNIFQ